MLTNMVLQDATEQDKEEIVDFFWKHATELHDDFETKQDVVNIQDRSYVIIRDDSLLIAAAAFAPLSTIRYGLNNVNWFLEWGARDARADEQGLYELMAAGAEKLGLCPTAVCTNFYDNAYTETLTTASKNDIYLGPALVHPEYRGRGMGTLLVESRIEKVKQSDAQYIFVECWPGPIRNIYERIGFTPVLETGPYGYAGASKLHMLMEVQ